MTEKIKCNRCLVSLDAEQFKMKRCGNRQKLCIQCCDKFVKWQQKQPKKEFKCLKCDYKCSQNGDLKKHIKAVHNKIKDIQCLKCDFKTSHNNNLQQHNKTCTGKSNLSSGEFKLQRILTEMNIDFTTGTYELRNPKTNKLLRWDIIIQTNGEPLFIEYDGRQHFQEIGCWDKLEDTQYRDKLKNDYCNDNGYMLLRIPYTEYENMEKLVVEFIRDNTDWGCG